MNNPEMWIAFNTEDKKPLNQMVYKSKIRAINAVDNYARNRVPQKMDKPKFTWLDDVIAIKDKFIFVNINITSMIDKGKEEWIIIGDKY